MRHILALYLFFYNALAFAQVIKVEVKDSKTGDPVQNVAVTLFSKTGDSLTTCYTNGRGQFLLQRINNQKLDSISQTFPIKSIKNLHFSHPIYQSVKKEISFLIQNSTEDTIRINTFLQTIKQKELKEIRLSAPRKADTVHSSDKLSILDFEIVKDGKLIMIMYPKSRENANELVFANDQEVLSQFTSRFPVRKLIRDYRGNVHAIGDEMVHGIQIQDNALQTAQVPLTYYIKYLAPLIDTTISKVYVSNFNSVYPAFEYYAMDKQDSTYRLVTNVKDDLMMSLYRSEYKWMDVRTKLWAKNKEIETGIDAEIWVGANFFTQSIYWEEVYAPLFERNDSVFVVNYPKDLLEIFDADGNNIKSIPIFHHYQRSKTGFKRKLIQDYTTGAIYAVYEKAGISYLGHLNVETGEINEKVKLNFKYIDQIKVYNNYVYYIYRPFESTQKRFLYKERLPYNFGKAKL
ncbi:MAG: hypothetical protein ACKO1R_08145, partial [Crocinitomicaceae bacterium]